MGYNIYIYQLFVMIGVHFKNKSGSPLNLTNLSHRGRFSTVRLCTEKSTGRLLAAKIIPYTEETKESTLLEYHILKKLHHTNVVQLHGAFLSPQDLALILELCEGRELLRCLSVG